MEEGDTMTLAAFFEAHPRAALAFSGGVDSAYLLAEALRCGAAVKPYCAVTPFQPAFELAEAEAFCRELGVELVRVPVPLLDWDTVAENPPDRCYFCKQRLLAALQAAAGRDGYTLLLDGTNASDQAADRPGMQALAEAGVLSPLRLCGLTKDAIRQRSRELRLPTWDKPAYACLATRIPSGQRITAALLRRVEYGEAALRELGFRDLRLRVFHDAARIQLPSAQLEAAARQHQALQQALRPWFSTVLLDMEGR